MFNNVIYFIIVLLILSISQQRGAPEDSLFYTGSMLVITWVIFAAYCRWGFQRLLHHLVKPERETAFPAEQYHALVFRLSVLAIFLFALDVHFFHIKIWLQLIPGIRELSVLQGILAVLVFVAYQVTIWYFAFPAYERAFQTGIARRSFIVSNLKLNVPILFPWVMLSLINDLIFLSSWTSLHIFMNRPGGEVLFFSLFLFILMIFMPGLIRTWWSCEPFLPSEKVAALKGFLQEKRFKYQELLRWPIFEGRIMTAGIMGMVPRFRYILITDALMDILSIEELKAVVAHEMGHARYRHFFFYLVFFIGFAVVSTGLWDFFAVLLSTQPFLMRIIGTGASADASFLYFLLALPILVGMVVYFRYVMGFFMRHFERQADLYSALTMGSPMQTISSLEKIAILSGKIRDLPSWHHFSIGRRVDYLWKSLRDPGLIRKHNRFVSLSFTLYLVGMISLGYFLNFSPTKEKLFNEWEEEAIYEHLVKNPNDVLLLQRLAMFYHKRGDLRETIKLYERVLSLDDSQPIALNNLAWILVTANEAEMRDKKRALALAQKAVALERSPVFLDTLAEALYANGFAPEAVETIKEAVDLARENVEYYRRQLLKFTGEIKET
jgi:Zn-dependent protease with chaperone function